MLRITKKQYSKPSIIKYGSAIRIIKGSGGSKYESYASHARS
ncbi:hypothetical protein SAMN02746089_01131 [Caldanaerobius fijiensis DSM 17918]|uniref:Uncharacterized protein n=1 Tax=Caldanaerobius fijiensis DSM 17918 TaxID=1121256 RepID=A0A1M4Y1L1_9THEO|nr:hypothetical protein [Caldanaerobius fijiensis]SHE99641.1 hypothetical protein SAMN02746089_01131 [Caldanaerobius fijiensis DSM 17918]